MRGDCLTCYLIEKFM